MRIWSARGGLWVDEAWSAVLVEPVRDPLDIVTRINHDNNHHLNSLWMWLWGFGAPPLTLRALSIVAGTLTVPVAYRIGTRCGPAQALILAALFAVSPMLVNYGSEARGYAPMLLAAMATIAMAQRWLEETREPAGARIALAAIALLGLMSQLTMVFFIAAILVAVGWSLTRRMPVAAAIGASLRWAWPMLAATALVFAVVIAAAAVSPVGMQVGDYVRYEPGLQVAALRTMVAATLGLPLSPAWLSPAWLSIAAAAAVLLLIADAVRRRADVAPFAVVAILGFPLMLALLRVGNTGMARYYLVASVAILWLVAGAVASLPRRWAIAASTLLIGASLYQDVVQAALLRGDPDAPVRIMAARAPRGTTIMVEYLRPVATLRVAAAQARYPLAITSTCPAAAYLYLDLDGSDHAPPAQSRCGAGYRRLTVGRRAMLSGTDWALYEKVAAR